MDTVDLIDTYPEDGDHAQTGELLDYLLCDGHHIGDDGRCAPATLYELGLVGPVVVVVDVGRCGKRALNVL
jgi:hypothetical protein